MNQSPTMMKSLLERRTVVSVLLFPSQPYASKPNRVLLFRRSDKVSTYQRKLAPIAGSVEKDDKNPLAAAWRELKEETGFGPQQIELWRRGVGFEFTDERAVSGQNPGQMKGRIWQVWPFAFRLREHIRDEDNDVDKLGLKLDWEHLGCEWRDVNDVLRGKILDDCVPRLEVTLGQVWVDPDGLLHQGLEELRLDHTHGARELATMAVKSLIRIVEQDQRNQHNQDTRQWWKGIQQQAFHLAFNGRPSMGAAISSALTTALQDAQAHIDAPMPDAITKVKRSLEAYVARRGQISKQVSDQFSGFLQNKFKSRAQEGTRTTSVKILTLSSSSTIKAALLAALDADEALSLELRILESRPLNEGVSFAKALIDEAQRRQELGASGPQFHNRLRIVLASDASVGILSKDVDLVILGADRVSESGDVSNKTGSLMTALVSQAVTGGSASVVCVTESEKIAIPGSTEDHPVEDNDTSELANSWHMQTSQLWNEMVTVRNVYFEWVPAKLISHYVCEDGELSTQEIQQKSNRVSELVKEVFPINQV